MTMMANAETDNLLLFFGLSNLIHLLILATTLQGACMSALKKLRN